MAKVKAPAIDTPQDGASANQPTKSSQVPKEKPKAGSRLKTASTIISIAVIFAGVFLAFGGERVIKDVYKYYKSRVSDTPATPVKVQQEKKSEPEPVNKMDWRLSPLSGAAFLTDDDIKYVDGSGKPHLVIIGHVFDVTNGFKSYQPGSGYHGFIGQDASRAFVTGQFDKDGLVNDLTGLTSQDFVGLADWLGFYIKTYPFVGYHYGRFFDKQKKATAAFHEFLAMQDVAAQEKLAKDAVQKEFPPCNTEWSDKAGTNVWCSVKSGGVDRNWIGFPVLFKESADKGPRCACVLESQLQDGRIQLYPGCDHKQHRCNRVGE